MISQTRSQNKEKIKLNKQGQTQIKRLRGDDLRELYFEVSRYLEIIQEESNKMKGTRLEGEFGLENQVADLEDLVKQIKEGGTH
jgi:hypothetical protein